MRDAEKVLAAGLFTLLIISWLGFSVHQSDDFAGSGIGAVFAISGSILMLAPLFYLIIKRVKWLKRLVTPIVSMRKLLTWHIYAGIIGPILVIIHTGHKFQSPLGIALTGFMLVVVGSGFIGRYLMSHFSIELKDKKRKLNLLEEKYKSFTEAVAEEPSLIQSIRFLKSPIARIFMRSFLGQKEMLSTEGLSLGCITETSESIADLEYAIKTHEIFKRWFRSWLKWHIVMSTIFYALMAVHIWASIHFGLRWL